MKIPPSLIPIFYSGSWLPCCIEASFCAHSVAINKKRLPTEGGLGLCAILSAFYAKASGLV